MADPSTVDNITNGISDVDLNDMHNSEEECGEQRDEILDSTDLPNVLIVTNVADAVFEDEEAKDEFEAVFCMYNPEASFSYLKSFRRVRVTYESPLDAVHARIQLHETELQGKTVKVYFSQPQENPASNSPHLHPPKPDKQFLISPPASPPVGWEPIPEAEPVINYDLLAAIATLAPGQAHELHPQSDNHPGIVVHICEDPDGYNEGPKISQTRRPIPR